MTKTQENINLAFAELNARMIASDQEWAKSKIEGKRDFIEAAEETFKTDKSRYNGGYGRFCATLAAYDHFGSKGMHNLLDGRSIKDALDMMLKNTMAKIAKRDAQIIKALEKAGINEIPEFTLSQSHRSNGVEGSFDVDDHTVTIMVDQFKIRTILAGGHSTPRLHARTFVKIT